MNHKNPTLKGNQPLISPYGGALVNLLVPPEQRSEVTQRASSLPSIQLSLRAECDLELLATGAFSPLDRFMDHADYQRVVQELRLAGGQLFPIPVTLPVQVGSKIRLDDEIALRNAKNELLAIMRIEEIYPWNLKEFSEAVLGTRDLRHPLVAEAHRWSKWMVSGRLNVLQLPRRQDFEELRHTPDEVRSILASLEKRNVVAFQTRNPLHRVHEELTKRASKDLDATLLLHPVVGMTKPGDVDYFTRVRTYKALAARYFDADQVVLSLLPLAMRLAGPREALWHAIIRRNFGANYLIVGRDHASPGADSNGKPIYPAYAAQTMLEQYSDEVGVRVVPFEELVYLPEEDIFEEVSKVPPQKSALSLSGTRVREEYLENGRELPGWFTRPEVASILVEAHPPRHRRGVCVWFTGLSGSGKSTTAEILTMQLLEHGRQVTVLDGDVVRTHLSKGLGFSKEDRDTNIRRIGFVASEIVRHGGVVICAAVSPYKATRNDVRSLIGQQQFIEVFVDTPLEVCESRDAKGLYAKARRGEIKDFTGIDDPYEPPENPELVIDTVSDTPKENSFRILQLLIGRGFVKEETWATAEDIGAEEAAR